MNAKLPLILVVALAAISGSLGAEKMSGLELADLPRFNGYIGIGPDLRFALTPVLPDGTFANLAWVKLGQQLGKYELVSFDAKTEVLKLKKPGFESVEVKLVESRVRDAGVSLGVSHAEARKYALDLVDTFLKAVREEHPERSVTMNPDLALMPDGQRERFLQTRKKMEDNGQFFTPFRLPDGRWGQAISGDETRKLPPEIYGNLSTDDRRAINAAWALAKAEAIARSIPPKVAKASN